MDPITPRNRSREVAPEVYWRRRLFALAAGLAVLGLLAWAVGGASVTHPTASDTSYNQSQRSAPTSFPTPTISSPSPSPSPSALSPSPTPSPSDSKPSAATQAKKAKVRAKRHGSGHRALAAGLNAPGDDCRPGDVVISLSAGGSSFRPGAHPRFTVTVVSTAGQTCAFNVGSRYLTLVIESGGVR
ncbi:MAG: hypothetical protein ACRDNF_24480, partial [Streptosporangiaceae bacterium]